MGLIAEDGNVQAVISDINEISFTVSVAPVTKKNHGRIIKRKTKNGTYYPQLLPSEAYGKYAQKVKPFLHTVYNILIGRKTIDYPVNLKCVFYLAQRRKGDLVGYLQAIQDLLVEAKILEDDNRNIVASTDGSEVLYDKDNPRTEITITKKEGYEQWLTKTK